MGKLHQLEFMIGRLGVCIVYSPKEWQWCNEGAQPDCDEGDVKAGSAIRWWVRLGPIELMWLPIVKSAFNSWLDVGM